jgi:hypothetical protein
MIRNKMIFICDSEGVPMEYDNDALIYDVRNYDSIQINQKLSTLVVGKHQEEHHRNNNASGSKNIVAWIASKERCSFINKQKWKRFLKAIKKCRKLKKSVSRGYSKNGISSFYYCFGFRKDPKSIDISKYANFGGTMKEIDFVNESIDDIVFSMEETVKPFLRNNSMFHKYKKIQTDYNIPSMNANGYATQFSVAKNYTSQMHVDKDYMYTVLTCFCENEFSIGKPIYHFCFPEYNAVIPMISGSVIAFDPRVVHCATNPKFAESYIMSCYVSKKTVDTVVAINEKMNLE